MLFGMVLALDADLVKVQIEIDDDRCIHHHGLSVEKIWVPSPLLHRCKGRLLQYRRPRNHCDLLGMAVLCNQDMQNDRSLQAHRARFFGIFQRGLLDEKALDDRG